MRDRRLFAVEYVHGVHTLFTRLILHSAFQSGANLCVL